MTTPPNIDEVLDTLHKHIWVGRTYLRMWRQLNDYLAAHASIHQVASAFFSFTLRSQIDSALLHLARLVDPHPEAVSVHYLLRVASSHAAAFPHGKKEDVLRGVEADRQRLAELVDTTRAILVRRDKQLAHTDKDTITKPAAVQAAGAITPKAVDDAYVEISNIVNRYSAYWRDSSTLPELLEWDDFEDLAEVAELGLEVREARRAERLAEAEARLRELEDK